VWLADWVINHHLDLNPMTLRHEPLMPTRRSLMKFFGLTALAGVGGTLAFNRAEANAYYRGPVSDHFDGVRFFNAGAEKPRPLTDLLRWQLLSASEAWPAAFTPWPQDTPPVRVGTEQMRISFIGHASFLVQTAGRNILIDPVFSRRASPFSFAGPMRVNEPGIAFDALPRIDTVLITHNHYDHLDTDTLGRLHQRFRPQVVTPLGNDQIIKAAIPDVAATGHDWGDIVAISPDIKIHLEPTLHWSARGLRDRGHALWASFVIQAPAGKLYCVGDTGFGNGDVFRRIAARHPGLAGALLPIGAYEPRWFMAEQHMNPAEAVEALKLCGAARAFGHHWGTFRLTNEAFDRPPTDLAAARGAAAMPANRFEALRPGEFKQIA
jgi:L-ascorbate metabolism protein UlaG (beta-lactamase superfamily)